MLNRVQAYVTGNDEARLGVISTMTHMPAQDPTDAPQSAGTLLLNALVETPLPGQPFDPYRPLFACLLMSHLVRNSELAKAAAREIALPSMDDEDEEEGDGLIQVIVGNLMMAAREQAECVNRRAKERPAAGATEESDWTRVMVGYLILLCTWLWDSPKSVKEFLNDSSNIQVVSSNLPSCGDELILHVADRADHPINWRRPNRTRPVRVPARRLLRV